ncbi:methyltransferase domain-containing protein [Helicobacter apodemus]|uniref:Methyltransferase domain-containing protein n=1 Tax=Helicobacter apodemus TaxID=135569 RepID=A0A4V6I6E8_9HELI|nr:methyltransferase domain-containing protein [Helicobacter apodemus]TLE14153.1 methyltransferase domain-containing protein [Helicobacter apodemus]
MVKEHLEYLICPVCKGSLKLQKEIYEGDLIKEGVLSCNCAKEYPIVNFIPRFVPKSNYADSFGFEWNMHKKTQFDSESGVEASKRRFYEETKWNPKEGGIILEAGCGSGRFTPYALQVVGREGLLISFDYSSAVDAALVGNPLSKNLLFLQANIYELPLKEWIIDKCFCFGVLQHTPSAKVAICSLIKSLKQGGEFVCDHYPFNHNTPFNTKYWVRPITTRIPHKMLYNFGRKYINFMWPLFKFNRKFFSPKRANRINWRLLIPDYSSEGLSEEKLKEWAYLDFFDMLSPKYDRPILMQTLYKYLVECGLENVQTKIGYNGWEGRGVKR